MKKLMFTFIAIVGFSFTSLANCDEQVIDCGEQVVGCSEQATEVCGNCYSVRIPLTGYLSVDSANLTATGGTMLRKPNLRELLMIADAVC